MDANVWAVILAGGRSKRMGAGVPKPLRVVGGKTLVSRVSATLEASGAPYENQIVVVSPDFDQGASGLEMSGCDWAIQREAKGTGDAARWGLAAIAKEEGDPLVIVALADVPFTRTATYKALIAGTPAGAVSFVSAEVPDPGSLGRVVRDASGAVQDIVEFKELAPGQEKISEINVGHFCGKKSLLLRLIGKIQPGAKGGELYLTSIVAAARQEGLSVTAVLASKPSEALGANTPEELEALARTAEKEGQ